MMRSGYTSFKTGNLTIRLSLTSVLGLVSPRTRQLQGTQQRLQQGGMVGVEGELIPRLIGDKRTSGTAREGWWGGLLLLTLLWRHLQDQAAGYVARPEWEAV